MKEVLLNIQKLQKSFDGVVPVNDVSFSIQKGTITLISGENGAGKTTLFNLITGLEVSNMGTIIFNGEDISKATPLHIARLGIVRMYQQCRLFKNLFVWENLLAAIPNNYSNNAISMLFNSEKVKSEEIKQKERAFGLLHQFGLEDLFNKVAGELSFGQQKLISFCMIVMNETKLALLDEPFAGLNPKTIDQLANLILQMRKDHVTFLIIEHNTNKALSICDNHFAMDEGQIIY